MHLHHQTSSRTRFPTACTLAVFKVLAAALVLGGALAVPRGAKAENARIDAHRQWLASEAPALNASAGTSPFQGSRTCARSGCHVTAPEEVVTSVHYQLQGKAPNVVAAGTNRLGLLTEYCGMQGSISSVNWLSIVQPTNSAYPARAEGCATCHAGLGARPNPIGKLTQADYDNVDCLICHSPSYTRTLIVTNGALKYVPSPDVDIRLAIQNVQRPTSDMCLRCHESAGGGPNFKHGVVPSPATDVHAAAGMQCVDCHTSNLHHIAGAGDLKAVDLPGTKVKCSECHTAAPHKGDNGMYNIHAERIACQTCHIPVAARSPSLPTVVQQDWTKPVMNPGTGLFEPARVLEKDVKPLYRWWNGKQERDGTPVGSFDDASAKIHPWKEVVSYVPADGTNTAALLPIKQAAYMTDGDVNRAVSMGAQESGTAYSGRWVRTARPMQYTLQHQVAPKAQALKCADCHAAEGGRFDFAALGYTSNQVAYLQSTTPWKGLAHTGRLGESYAGPASCTQCHGGKVEEVMDSVHYTWRTPNPRMAYPGGGSHGMIDRVDGLVGANAANNYFADLREGAVACGKCHTGHNVPLPNIQTGQYSQEQKDGLDCLICHAADNSYDMDGDGQMTAKDESALFRKLSKDPKTGQPVWLQDRSLRAAESVGARVTVGACLRCHEPGQGAPDYRRGTPYHPSTDVHAAAGMLCTSCHQVSGHKIARGSRVADLHAWERPNVEVDCKQCHGARPHPEWPTNPAFVPYNEHSQYISCQTCHIPAVSGVARQAWYSGNPTNSAPEFDPVAGIWEPEIQYTPMVRPEYRWFNGDTSMNAEPLHDATAWDFKVATKATPGAMIYPFRKLVNGLVFDAKGLEGGGTNAYTLAAAVDANATYLKKMGFLRAEGLTAAERAVLEKTPNLLTFEKEEYVRTGNVKEAVNLGLGRMALLQAGKNPFTASPAEVSAAGAKLWSGELAGLDVPVNPNDPKFNAARKESTGSFISVNHGVVRNEAFRCAQCHSENSVMDFEALSYTPEEAAWLQTLFKNVQITRSTRVAQGLKLRWTAKRGMRYQIVTASDLASGTWTAVTQPENALSEWMERVVPNAALTNAGAMFFRVKEVPR